MIRKRLITLVSAVLMSLGAVVVVATPAQAAAEFDYAVDATWSDEHTKTCLYGTYMAACLQPYGDYIWIQDRYKDGNSVWVRWWDQDGDRNGTCYNNLGVDRAWTWCNKNFPEGHIIKWEMHYYDDNGTAKTLGPLTTTM